MPRAVTRPFSPPVFGDPFLWVVPCHGCCFRNSSSEWRRVPEPAAPSATPLPPCHARPAPAAAASSSAGPVPAASAGSEPAASTYSPLQPSASTSQPQAGRPRRGDRQPRPGPAAAHSRGHPA